MDESGVQIGDIGNSKVIKENINDNQKAIIAKPARHQWTSSLESISTAGRKIDPLLIFPG
jgi:hypothetical protein